MKKKKKNAEIKGQFLMSGLILKERMNTNDLIGRVHELLSLKQST